jgi:hypothetical protein
VAFERDAELGRQDSAAIVFHADQARAARQQAHGDLAGAGIQGVVDQLAHHRGWPLNDLARGDLADQFVGELADRAARRGNRQVRHPGILGGGP